MAPVVEEKSGRRPLGTPAGTSFRTVYYNPLLHRPVGRIRDVRLAAMPRWRRVAAASSRVGGGRFDRGFRPAETARRRPCSRVRAPTSSCCADAWSASMPSRRPPPTRPPTPAISPAPASSCEPRPEKPFGFLPEDAKAGIFTDPEVRTRELEVHGWRRARRRPRGSVGLLDRRRRPPPSPLPLRRLQHHHQRARPVLVLRRSVRAARGARLGGRRKRRPGPETPRTAWSTMPGAPRLRSSDCGRCSPPAAGWWPSPAPASRPSPASPTSGAPAGSGAGCSPSTSRTSWPPTRCAASRGGARSPPTAPSPRRSPTAATAPSRRCTAAAPARA